MREVASPVAIVTTQSATDKGGMTISSFSSVSVSPEAMISFNMQTPTRTFALLEKAPKFAVNVLNSSQESMQLALAFSGQLGPMNPFEKFPRLFDESAGLPILKHCSSTFICEIANIVPVQDHRIVVARVIDVLPRMGGSMCYQDRRFHILGEALK